MRKSLVYGLATLLLIFMLGLAFFSMTGDSAIMDEVAHLPAGYSYISQADMRLNPEHPPLIKDLAGGMVWLYSKIFHQPIAFPLQIDAWQNDINGQWEFGFDFMYKEGNNADLMLLLGRLPTLLILLILGIYIFKWAKQLYGPAAGLLALFFYSFSPTFLAHGRFITTDVAATAAIFIASYYFVRWLKNPTGGNLAIAGIVFGLAQLAKFSVFLLIPLFGFIAVVWCFLKFHEAKHNNLPVNAWTFFWQYIGGAISIMVIGYVFIVWPIYVYHTLNYPVERQQRDTQLILSSFGIRPLANLLYWMAGMPILRGLAEYGLGLAMVLQRAAGGNTTYFLGEVSAAGSRLYFPFVYAVKETLAFHIFTLTAILLALTGFFKKQLYRLLKLGAFIREHIAGFLMLCFIALYWFTSVRSPLNIGVRHILPTFPFIFALVAGQLLGWLKNPHPSSPMPAADGQTKKSSDKKIAVGILVALSGALILWQIFSVVSVYPSFLAYFNELAGGPANGYKYVADSNLDWGQDLKRLAQWTDKNNVGRIYVDYFGGAIVPYYLGDKFMPWWGTRLPQDLNATGGYLAVSATFLDGGRGKPAPGFSEPTGYYDWLNNFTPVAVIGHSIFVYHIPPNSFNNIATH
jgi:4-amino-4-deoxy-L-arabinose transferase-like glycosyltransferase